MNFLRFKQKGSVFILMAITIPFLLLSSAIAVDVGALYVQRSHMQNIADAAALAGASQLQTSESAAKSLAQNYGKKNGETILDGQITFLTDGTTKKIRVDINKDAPLLFFKYFQDVLGTNIIPPFALTVHAIAASTGGTKNIFDYSLLSGAKEGEAINTKQTSQYAYKYNTSPDPRVMNLGSGGGNTYNGKIHSNYQIFTANNNNTTNALFSTVSSVGWTSNSSGIQNTPVATNSNAIDIAVASSPLSNIIANLKTNSNYLGNYSSGNYTTSFDTAVLAANGKGLYVHGNFKPDYTQSLANSTIIIADGDIFVPSENGRPLGDNHIIFCSLHGNIYYNFGSTFNGILYAPEGNIMVSGQVIFNGSIVGQTVIAADGNNIITHKDFPETSGAGSNSSTKIQLIE